MIPTRKDRRRQRRSRSVRATHERHEDALRLAKPPETEAPRRTPRGGRSPGDAGRGSSTTPTYSPSRAPATGSATAASTPSQHPHRRQPTRRPGSPANHTAHFSTVTTAQNSTVTDTATAPQELALVVLTDSQIGLRSWTASNHVRDRKWHVPRLKATRPGHHRVPQRAQHVEVETIEHRMFSVASGCAGSCDMTSIGRVSPVSGLTRAVVRCREFCRKTAEHDARRANTARTRYLS